MRDFILCVGVSRLHVPKYTVCVASDRGGERKASDPPAHPGGTDG